MKLRELKRQDKEAYVAMSKEFYESEAVLHPVPERNFERTFDLLLSGSPFAKACIAENDNGSAVGYALLSFSWSNEAGGFVVWLEEIYIRPEFRNAGLGRLIISKIVNKYGKDAARFRLEVEASNTGAKRLYQRIGFQELQYQQMIYELIN